MSNHEHEVDALIRAHLQRQAESVDPAAILAEVRAQSGIRSPRRNLRRNLRRCLWGLVTAAAVVLAFLGGQHVGPAQASAESLVREARQAHALPVDRCYLVQTVPVPGGVLARFPALSQPRETRLWTRGDRFWIESTNPERKWAWGRDDQGTLWLALGRKHGLRYEADEVPEPLGVACDVCSMQVETLLEEVLRDFDLVRERPEGDMATGTYRVQAEPKRGRQPPGLRTALLEVDVESRVLRRLVLHRTRRGRPLATVTFTLVESQTQNENTYHLEGHLEADAPIYSSLNKRPQRDLLLRAFFGISLGTRWRGEGSRDDS
jgi:hypothetical protein